MLLAQQGSRPTTTGGHYAIEVALRAQFGETTSHEEAGTAITDAGRIHRAAHQLLATLPIF
jgi:hypothetical protein